MKPQMPTGETPCSSRKPENPVKESSGKPSDVTAATRLSRIDQHLTEDVRVSWLAEIELLLLTFCTGIQGALTPPTLSETICILIKAYCRCRLFPGLPLLYLKPNRQHRLPRLGIHSPQD
jgi:hypothetical protein